jgi:hypothetical protein
MPTCPICQDDSAPAELLPKMGDRSDIQCQRCGHYSLVGTLADTDLLKRLDPQQRALLSGWIREQFEAGSKPTIRSDDLERILQFSRPTLKERAHRILTHLDRHQARFGETFDNQHPSLISVAYAIDRRELLFVLRYLVDQKLIEGRSPTTPEVMRITPDGHAYIDELGARGRTSLQGFVAMSFARDMTDVYDAGFEPGIRAAGYRPLRVDRHEHVNRIDDEIIAQIRRSRFIVADFTGHRGGVYFEAGFALGLNLPVIWTCRRDDMKNLHFDIRQFNCLGWDSPTALAGPLQLRIEAVVGQGPVLPA